MNIQKCHGALMPGPFSVTQSANLIPDLFTERDPWAVKADRSSSSSVRFSTVTLFQAGEAGLPADGCSGSLSGRPPAGTDLIQANQSWNKEHFSDFT
ncbi:hypothetical protein P4O66_005064 [Electrophorus voltai]|uniref:Uncharacterized protein n=1 Tax=Electrophorus voltai TaxID=2609070 RepID=A0AAD9E6T7_9TELE|nr:hypothetical protein P4O66_005064 [Electrophorus voltai]